MCWLSAYACIRWLSANYGSENKIASDDTRGLHTDHAAFCEEADLLRYRLGVGASVDSFDAGVHSSRRKPKVMTLRSRQKAAFASRHKKQRISKDRITVAES